ncbi:MAG TPA: iron-sulfur cluster carrier protein ApbC [Steroidobacteraceae bacterium]|nr:iron-sulfur cluster carrier protein ApbC [Steroidobacteraceae bacterium]
MTNANESAVRAVLESELEPYSGRPLAQLTHTVTAGRDETAVSLTLPFPAAHYASELRERLGARLPPNTRLEIHWQVVSQGTRRPVNAIPGIRNIIAVASGKGGVGKSTTAANLALALAYDGASVGLLDADIYGPSQPRMMGLPNEKPTSRDGKTFDPPVAYGVKVSSIGFLVDEEQPLIWRGPMVTQALMQLLNDSRWGELDYLIVDMPPGTGDTQLTLSQRVPLSGAVIVTTPQDIALLDARRGLRMFEKVDVPILGIVENMSTHICSNCGHEEHIFGAGGGRAMAQQYGVELLAELPLHAQIREETDSGRPTVVAQPDGSLGRAYIDMARRTAARLAFASELSRPVFPKIEIEDT